MSKGKKKRTKPAEEVCPMCGAQLAEYEHHKGFEGGRPRMTLECVVCEYKLILCEGETAEQWLMQYKKEKA